MSRRSHTDHNAGVRWTVHSQRS